MQRFFPEQRKKRIPMGDPWALYVGYVITDAKTVLVSIPYDCKWGFALSDGTRLWPGGFGAANRTEPIKPTDRRITDRDREAMQWILDAQTWL